jgi:hypothetical protein
MGHSWRDAGRDSIGIDGFVEIVRIGQATGQIIGIQIKAGRSFLTTKKSRDGKAKRLSVDRRIIRVERRHLEYFKTCRFPVIVALYDPNSRNVFWGPVGNDAETSLPIPHTLDRFSGKRVARVADHWHSSYPTYTDPRTPGVTITSGKLAARQYYDQLRKMGCFSPSYGWVSFTLRGWRHITKQNKERDKVLRSLELLGAGVQILSEKTPFHLCRKTDAGHLLYKQTARVKHPNRADAIISVIVEKIGDKPHQFLSVYEHGGKGVKALPQKRAHSRARPEEE